MSKYKLTKKEQKKLELFFDDVVLCNEDYSIEDVRKGYFICTSLSHLLDYCCGDTAVATVEDNLDEDEWDLGYEEHLGNFFDGMYAKLSDNRFVGFAFDK